MNSDDWMRSHLRRRGPSKAPGPRPQAQGPKSKVSGIEKIRLLFFLRNLTKDKAMIEKLKSRKLWVAVGGAAVVALLNGLGLSEDMTTKLVVLLSTYIGGQSLVDAFARPKA